MGIANMWQSIKNADPIVKAALIGLVGVVLAAIISGIFQLVTSKTPQTVLNPTPTTPTLAPTATMPISVNSPSPSTSAPSPTSTTFTSDLLTVPSTTQDGVSFRAPTNGTYRITYVSGAYTTYGGAPWISIIHIYKNRPIQWSNTQQPGPTNADDYIGTGREGDNAATATALVKTDKSIVSFTLQKDNTLLFVAADVKGQYSDNQGQVILQIELIQ